LGDKELEMKNKLLLIGLIVVVAVARYAIGNYEFSQAGSVTEIFIIRGVGSLFMDFRLKVLLMMATVALIVVDWRRNKRPDYFWVGVAGTLIAALLEILAIASGERQIHANYLFGLELPLMVDLPVRAIAEFAFYAVLLLFFTDRMLPEKTRKNTIIVFAIVTVAFNAVSFANGIQTPHYGGNVLSRRAMSGTGSLILMGILVYIVAAFFLTKPRSEGDEAGRYLLARPTDADRQRGLYLLILLAIFLSVGQLTEYLAGARWVEIGPFGSTRHAHPLIELIGLAYNALVEGAVYYMPYYTIPLGLKLIESIKKEAES
jgi:hypothetical protein